MDTAVPGQELAPGQVAEPGLISPNLTPFNADLTVDTALYVAHAKHLLANGCVSLAPFGTTGEALSVGIEERLAVLEALIDAGVPAQRLLPGTGLTNLPDTVRLTKAATEAGCGGTMVLPPFYYKDPADDGLYAYFARLIEMVGSDELKICLYHIPQVSGVGFPVPLVARLRADFPDQIVAIKDSSGDWANTEALMEIDGLTVYPGAEAFLLPALERGGPGCISAVSNVNSLAIAAVIDAFRDGDQEKAGALFEKARAVRAAVVPYGPIPALKRLLAMESGNDAWATVRPPFLPLSEEDGRALKAKLDALR